MCIGAGKSPKTPNMSAYNADAGKESKSVLGLTDRIRDDVHAIVPFSRPRSVHRERVKERRGQPMTIRVVRT